ncbi:MAG: N-formylglutamate amidohydrolase [Pacificimonas sp.]
MTAPDILDGRADLLLVADHAGSRVPTGVDLGVPAAELRRHIAVDIGIDPLTRALSRELDAPAVIATVSRLVADPNRDPNEPGFAPRESDGAIITGNQVLTAADRRERVRLHAAYHEAIEAELDRRRARLFVSLHSFTDKLRTSPAAVRPWQVGLLYNEDGATAARAIDWLRQKGLTVGDNEPYSGALTG